VTTRYTHLHPAEQSRLKYGLAFRAIDARNGNKTCRDICESDLIPVTLRRGLVGAGGSGLYVEVIRTGCCRLLWPAPRYTTNAPVEFTQISDTQLLIDRDTVSDLKRMPLTRVK
jgi:hypothetical protein